MKAQEICVSMCCVLLHSLCSPLIALIFAGWNLVNMGTNKLLEQDPTWTPVMFPRHSAAIVAALILCFWRVVLFHCWGRKWNNVEHFLQADKNIISTYFYSVKGKPPHVTSVVELWLLAQQVQLLGFSSCGGCHEGNKTDAWREAYTCRLRRRSQWVLQGLLLLGYQIREDQGRYVIRIYIYNM